MLNNLVDYSLKKLIDYTEETGGSILRGAGLLAHVLEDQAYA